MSARIVVWDPSGQYNEGAVVDGHKADALVARGVTSLPCDVDAFRVNPVSGYMRRAWGAGWTFDPVSPRRGCPLVLYVTGGNPLIHWCARIVPVKGETDRGGTLRLSTDTSHRAVVAGGLAPDLPPPEIAKVSARASGDADGGWTLYGRNKFTVSMEGYLGLSLYGTGRHVRVTWAAVTQTKE